MAGDVDNRVPEDVNKIPAQNDLQSPGSGSWIWKAVWTVVVIGAVPLLAFGIKYYQDARLVRRHVRLTFHQISQTCK